MQHDFLLAKLSWKFYIFKQYGDTIWGTFPLSFYKEEGQSIFFEVGTERDSPHTRGGTLENVPI